MRTLVGGGWGSTNFEGLGAAGPTILGLKSGTPPGAASCPQLPFIREPLTCEA